MRRLLMAVSLLPVLAAFTFAAFGVWDVGGRGEEWIGSMFLAMVASIPGVAWVAAEVTA